MVKRLRALAGDEAAWRDPTLALKSVYAELIRYQLTEWLAEED